MAIIEVRLSTDEKGFHDHDAAKEAISKLLCELNPKAQVTVIFSLDNHDYDQPHEWTINLIAQRLAAYPHVKIKFKAPKPSVAESWEQALKTAMQKLAGTKAVKRG